MKSLTFLPSELALQSISEREIVLPLNAAIEAVDYFASKHIHILGWEGWILTEDGRVGHGSAPQGTTNLEDLSPLDAAELCRQTIPVAAREWSRDHPDSTDRLHFCITILCEPVRNIAGT
jgi:hypothetical protein